jgi:hypothetical protein
MWVFGSAPTPLDEVSNCKNETAALELKPAGLQAGNN